MFFRSGIYAVPGSILHSVGSVGVLFLYWIIAPLCACGKSSISYVVNALLKEPHSWPYSILRIGVPISETLGR